jgi:hypothetical protein
MQPFQDFLNESLETKKAANEAREKISPKVIDAIKKAWNSSSFPKSLYEDPKSKIFKVKVEKPPFFGIDTELRYAKSDDYILGVDISYRIEIFGKDKDVAWEGINYEFGVKNDKGVYKVGRFTASGGIQGSVLWQGKKVSDLENPETWKKVKNNYEKDKGIDWSIDGQISDINNALKEMGSKLVIKI